MKPDPVLLIGLCVFVGIIGIMFYGLWLQRKAFQTQQRSANTQKEAAERGRISFELQTEGREQVKKSIQAQEEAMLLQRESIKQLQEIIVLLQGIHEKLDQR